MHPDEEHPTPLLSSSGGLKDPAAWWPSKLAGAEHVRGDAQCDTAVQVDAPFQWCARCQGNMAFLSLGTIKHHTNKAFCVEIACFAELAARRDKK